MSPARETRRRRCASFDSPSALARSRPVLDAPHACLPASLAQDALAEASTSETGAKPKAGFGWSHSFLHLKQWHPLSFKNQEKLFLAEQAEADRRRRGTRRRRRSSPPTRNFSKTRSCSAPRTARRCETNSSSHSCTRNLRGSTPCSRSRRRRQKPRRTPPAPRRKPPREPPSARHRAFPARAGGHRPAQVAEAAQGRVRAKRPHKRGGTRARGRARRAGRLRDDTSKPLGKIIRAHTVQAVRRVRPRQRR